MKPEKKGLRGETIIKLFFGAMIITNLLLALGVAILAWQLLR